MFNSSLDKVNSIYQEATACTYCFDQRLVREGMIKMAQPRPIGRDYWKSEKRVVVVLLNPGKRKDKEYGLILDKYKKGVTSLENLFEFQYKNMCEWGRYPGHFYGFYFCKLGLSMDQVAFVNIALCETEGNKYPSKVIQKCMKKFTLPLLESLKPNIILLSGLRVQALEEEIQKHIPNAGIVKVPHYAHRKGNAYKEAELLEAKSYWLIEKQDRG